MRRAGTWEEEGDLGGGRGDSEVRWVIVCESGDSM